MTDLHPLRVIAFPGAPNLPTFAAIEQGHFAAQGLSVSVEMTPSSVYQAQEMAKGNFDIAFTAFDNVVAYSEGQGAAGPDVDPDYVAVMGATQLEVSLIVAPGIRTFADLKGRTIALDARDTGFAFVLSEMLERAGLSKSDTNYVPVGATPQRWESVRDGTHAGTLTIEPFTTIAEDAGFPVLQSSTEIFDSYQGGIVATQRNFAAANAEALRGFLRGYLAGLAWVRDPANAQAAATLLLAKLPAIKPQAVTAVMRSLLDPRSGLTPDAAILRDGMARVLDLRSRHGSAGKTLTDIDRYIDLGHYDAVMAERAR